VTGYQAVPSGRRVSNLPVPGPSVVAILAAAALHLARPWTLPGSRVVHRVVGGLVVAGGTCLVAESWGAAGSVDLARPGRLVTAGPYADRRNPMYVGWVLLHLGVGVAAGSAWIVASLPVAAPFLHRAVLREEHVLTEQFPIEFERYRAAVPRY
jgi:protein-S-isoprenylcysteine O-methyltransferase Ste14